MNKQIKNDSMVLVNIVELATELAQKDIDMANNGDYELLYNEDGTFKYKAQDEFNDLYDYYYDLILNCK